MALIDFGSRACAEGRKMAKVISVEVEVEACRTRRSVPPVPETAVFDKTSRLLLVVVALMLLPMVLDIHAEDMPKEDVPKCVRWVVVPIRYPSRRYAEMCEVVRQWAWANNTSNS